MRIFYLIGFSLSFLSLPVLAKYVTLFDTTAGKKYIICSENKGFTLRQCEANVELSLKLCSREDCKSLNSLTEESFFKHLKLDTGPYSKDFSSVAVIKEAIQISSNSEKRTKLEGWLKNLEQINKLREDLLADKISGPYDEDTTNFRQIVSAFDVSITKETAKGGKDKCEDGCLSVMNICSDPCSQVWGRGGSHPKPGDSLPSNLAEKSAQERACLIKCADQFNSCLKDRCGLPARNVVPLRGRLIGADSPSNLKK